MSNSNKDKDKNNPVLAVFDARPEPVSTFKKEYGCKLFYYKANDGFVADIYKNAPELGEPRKVKYLCLRLDDVINTPLQIDLNSNELSTIINNEYQINFESEVGEESFFNDLFFFMEELHGITKDRNSSPNKIINLVDELETLKQGEINE